MRHDDVELVFKALADGKTFQESGLPNTAEFWGLWRHLEAELRQLGMKLEKKMPNTTPYRRRVTDQPSS